MCNLPALLAFCSFQGQSVPSEKQQKHVVNFVTVVALCQCTAWRDRGRQCAMPGLILSSPQPSAMADMRKATTYGGDPSGHEHSQVCEAQLARTHPAAPDDPTVLGPRLKGHGVRAPVENPYTCAGLKDLVGEAPPS